jgi:VanZ family protein
VKPVLRPELRYRRLWFFVGLAFAVVVTYLCLAPTKNLPSLHLWDKFEHSLAFVALAFWFGSIVVRRDIPWVGVMLVVFGGLIELVQGWMGLGRSADIMDLLADSVGIALGLLLVFSPLGRIAPWLESKLFGARA